MRYLEINIFASYNTPDNIIFVRVVHYHLPCNKGKLIPLCIYRYMYTIELALSKSFSYCEDLKK